MRLKLAEHHQRIWLSYQEEEKNCSLLEAAMEKITWIVSPGIVCWTREKSITIQINANTNAPTTQQRIWQEMNKWIPLSLINFVDVAKTRLLCNIQTYMFRNIFSSMRKLNLIALQQTRRRNYDKTLRVTPPNWHCHLHFQFSNPELTF